MATKQTLNILVNNAGFLDHNEVVIEPKLESHIAGP